MRKDSKQNSIIDLRIGAILYISAFSFVYFMFAKIVRLMRCKKVQTIIIRFHISWYELVIFTLHICDRIAPSVYKVITIE